MFEEPFKRKKFKRKFNMKRLSYLTLICLLIIGVQAKANASVVSLVDLNLADAMSITGQTNTVGGITVTERYAESTLIPYDSQYPFPVGSCTSAIVTPSHTYFDKVVSFTGAIAGDLFEFEFQILNDTPYDWCDYHFEIWDTTFTTRQTASWFYDDAQLDLFSDRFTGLELHTDVATFYGTPGHKVGDTGVYRLKMELFAFANSDFGSFGMRQVATTPEPASMAIFGIGGSMLMFVRRRRARLTAKANENI